MGKTIQVQKLQFGLGTCLVATVHFFIKSTCLRWPVAQTFFTWWLATMPRHGHKTNCVSALIHIVEHVLTPPSTTHFSNVWHFCVVYLFAVKVFCVYLLMRLRQHVTTLCTGHYENESEVSYHLMTMNTTTIQWSNWVRPRSLLQQQDHYWNVRLCKHIRHPSRGYLLTKELDSPNLSSYAINISQTFGMNGVKVFKL